ncbi:MAG: hypothetical protein ABSD52_13425 [Candidatus Cybelea sp.]|jgi:hypothetical protein
MKLMITTILCSCAFLGFSVAGASAQTSYTLSGTCKVSVQKSIPAGDQPGHAFVIQAGKCTDKESIAGATATGGQYAEHSDVTASSSNGAGIFTVTYNTGDKTFYRYSLSVSTKNGAVQSGTGTFMAVGGTGKMKGVAAKGTCTFGPGPTSGTNTFMCAGQYTLGAASP